MDQALIAYRNSNPTFKRQVLDLAFVNLKSTSRQAICIILANKMFPRTFSELNSKPLSKIKVALKYALSPLIFNGLLQNGIFLLQKQALHVANESLKQNWVFKLLTSTASRVLITNIAAMASNYFSNKSRGISRPSASFVACVDLLYASRTIAYEEKGSWLYLLPL